MERKNKVQEGQSTEGMLQYRKLGGGSMRLSGRIIKPNERFFARPEDIPTGFKRFLQVVSDDVTVATVTKEKAEKTQQLAEPENLFTIEPDEEKEGFYNVVNSVDKKFINDKPLRKKAAENLLESLEE